MEYVLAIVVLWVLGWLGRGSLSLASVALLPFSLFRLYNEDEYKSRKDRVITVAFGIVVWVVAIVLLSDIIRDVLTGAFWGCPAGQHLSGGQGGGEQYCE